MCNQAKAIPTGPCATPELLNCVRTALLDWFRRHRRELPWRHTRDPYAIWVSETMLQQTQVQTVVPYFLRWMERFPTVGALAEAPLEEVLRYWAGLGYYARARNLHVAAQTIVHRYGGQIPPQRSALLALAGIGRYTAGAIQSIAFGQRAPCLDANASRVLSRLFLITGDQTRADTQRSLWTLAEDLVPEETPGDFNQALMELGAIICTPHAPRCSECPLHDCCAALATGKVSEIPKPRKRPPTACVEHVSAVLQKDDTFLLVQRPLNERWGGLWELPRTERRSQEPLEACAVRAVQETVSLQVSAGSPLGFIRHTVTHYRVTLHAVAVSHPAGMPQAVGCADWQWVPAAAIKSFPLSAPQARLFRSVIPLRQNPP